MLSIYRRGVSGVSIICCGSDAIQGRVLEQCAIITWLQVNLFQKLFVDSFDKQDQLSGISVHIQSIDGARLVTNWLMFGGQPPKFGW